MNYEFEVIILNAQGEEIRREKKTTSYRIENLGNDLSLEMVAIAGGDFLMGSPETEEGFHSSQSPQHLVTVPSFFMSKYPITQAQWEIVAKFPKVNQHLNPNSSNFQGENLPVEQISWYDAVEFCARLSHYSGYDYSLPSEAQWEYACRANTVTPFHFGETLTTDVANYSGMNWEYQGKICSKGYYGKGPTGEDRRQTTPVGSFKVANAFGLYDLHGNVREWCADYWHNYYQGCPTDGSSWITGGDETKRVLRGGSWNGGPHKCRCAYRAKFSADASLYDIGFRVVHAE